jgi:hypothetical protein
MLELETSEVLSEMATGIVVDGVSVQAIVGITEQKRHEISGLMVETLRLVAVALALGPVAVGQLITVDGVDWEVEAVRRSANMVVVNLARNLG